tara:strand:- start:394 stop:876 length:483 start_codon:yes stop_codon:yes gene_type:complete
MLSTVTNYKYSELDKLDEYNEVDENRLLNECNPPVPPNFISKINYLLSNSEYNIIIGDVKLFHILNIFIRYNTFDPINMFNLIINIHNTNIQKHGIIWDLQEICITLSTQYIIVDSSFEWLYELYNYVIFWYLYKVDRKPHFFDYSIEAWNACFELVNTS